MCSLWTEQGSEEGRGFKQTIDLLLCSARRTLCASSSSASTTFTTASDLVLANDICYAIHDFSICSSSNSDDETKHTIGFEYRGNLCTSFKARLALSLEAKDTNA